jgi:hypothetical protein
MSDPDICGTCGLFMRGPDVTGDACPGHDKLEIAPNGVPYRDMWAGGVGPRLRADQSIGNPGTLAREAYSNIPIYDVGAEFDRIRREYGGLGEGAWASAKWYAEALVRSRAELEREVANVCEAYKACSDDLIKCDAEVMRWFKAASPYATPGSLERGLKKLREELIEECALICESRAGEGQYAESQAAWRILLSAAHAIRALKKFQPGPIDSTVKPSAWD